MFKLYQPGSAASEYTNSRLLPQQRAWLSDKMFPQGCYHDLLSRSLYYFPSHSHVLPFRPPTPGHVHGHFRHDLHGNGRIHGGLSPYLPFDTRLLANKSILYDALKTKMNEDGKQSAEVKVDALTTAMTSPSGYTNGSNVETLATPSSTLSPEAKKSFTCPQCKYSTDRKNNLKRHVITMHFDCDRKLECCGTVFRSKAKLREHVTLFHKNGYRCLVCARMFCRKALLRRHMAVHSGKKDFHCEFCSYATSHKSNLERHQKVHSKSARFIYSHRKPVACFERKFCPVKNVDEVVRDTSNVQKDEFEFQESREMEENDKLKLAEKEINITSEEEPVDMSDADKMDNDVMEDIDKCDVFDAHDNDFYKSDDDNMEANHFQSQNEAVDAEMSDTISDIHKLKLNTINYVFQPFENDIEHISDSWKNYEVGDMTDKRGIGDIIKAMDDADKRIGDKENLVENHIDDKENLVENRIDDKENLVENRIDDKENLVEKHIDDGENLKCDQLNDTQSTQNVNKSNRKLCPRLCGLPYRCASCGDRFESQDRFNQHLCEASDSCAGDTAEQSVSLVALILKQGKNCIF